MTLKFKKNPTLEIVVKINLFKKKTCETDRHVPFILMITNEY